MMIAAAVYDPGPREIDNSNIIELENRRTVKVQVEEELEVVGDVEETRAQRTVEKVKKAVVGARSFAEQLTTWKQSNLGG